MFQATRLHPSFQVLPRRIEPYDFLKGQGWVSALPHSPVNVFDSIIAVTLSKEGMELEMEETVVLSLNLVIC